MKRRATISKETYDWLVRWTFSLKAPPLTNQIKKDLAKFKPLKPVRLYRAESPEKRCKPLKSYSHNKEMVLFLIETHEQEGEPVNYIERIVNPKDILVDFTLLPKLPEEFLDEVIVFSRGCKK